MVKLYKYKKKIYVDHPKHYCYDCKRDQGSMLALKRHNCPKKKLTPSKRCSKKNKAAL